MKEDNKRRDLQEEKFSLEDLRKLTIRTLEAKIRENSIAFIQQIMLDEVETLCGKACQHKNGDLAYRGGSDKGSVTIQGKKVAFKKPRVGQYGKEIQLQSYTKLHAMENISELVFKMMINGTSSRSYQEVMEEFENEFGISKSSVSRHFIRKSREYLNHVNSRKFPDKVFWAILVDGIYIGGDVIIAILGVDTEGNKHFLGISQGSTENSIVVKECFEGLRQREIRFTDRVVAVLDGSRALHKSVREFFEGKANIQRCLLHKIRNVEAKLSKKYHDEFKSRIHQAYNLNDFHEARLEFENLLSWLKEISYNASESFKEGLEELLTLHKIKMPPEMRKSFYTTNSIDSAFSTPRFRMNRVKNWIKKGDMIKRWAGAALLYQEKQFRRVNYYDLIPLFLEQYIGQEM